MKPISDFTRVELKVLAQVCRDMPGQAVEEYADNRLLSTLILILSERLDKAREAGRGGWWREDGRTVEDLRAALQTQIDKGDMLDALLYCGMIYMRKAAGPGDSK